jgi:hypothetical protein
MEIGLGENNLESCFRTKDIYSATILLRDLFLLPRWGRYDKIFKFLQFINYLVKILIEL